MRSGADKNENHTPAQADKNNTTTTKHHARKTIGHY